ncbi:MAG: putative metal-dependent phosphoesterases (PHP family) [Idiomarinaceae bacterium HL-53]|nr:MAG: putative metal-dependent phosphoesterases (PHP family) [Idiomarinaceae bacterium HL-53]CUS48633.1 hypothetical protein Ga0003345_1600 [Idiomarinaceae bacterium HL-53]
MNSMSKTQNETSIRIDLHAHTNLSDGALSPDLLMLRAEQMQLDYFAITDHDSVAALAEARAAKVRLKLKRPELISGIEVSCRWHSFEIHVLGWNFDETHPRMLRLVAAQQQRRAERAAAIAEKLIKAGVDKAHLPKLEPIETNRVLTRPHFAEALVKHGYVASIEEAFKKYLRKGERAYVATPWVSIDEAVAVIKEAGGTAGLAHPLAYQLSAKWLKRLLSQFVAAGGEALEVVSSQQTPEQRRYLQELADTYGLCTSVGSDFHKPSPWRELGKNLTLPEQAVPVWQSWQLNE